MTAERILEEVKRLIDTKYWDSGDWGDFVLNVVREALDNLGKEAQP